jgi:predicted lipid-binding transport protein (Tim44 family)
MTTNITGVGKPRRRFGAPKNWRIQFLAALAETSNVTASADKAEISPSWVYKTRREDHAFARQWLVALCDGYDRLEMDVLKRLRDGEKRDGGETRFDNAAAIRLLSLHKGDVARARALRDNSEEDAVLESIDAMIDAMRERSSANTPIDADRDDALG